MEENINEETFIPEEIPQVSTTIPLFIKKLWKMVNDTEAENIICWNAKGDGFIIQDQLQFITTLLPQYFKHNNLASFYRQLNFYNFHKVPNINHEIEFSHDCFIKDMPEVLPLIRRKNPIGKSKTEHNFKEQEVEGLLKDVKNLKGKHSLIDKELALLKRENVGLWTELNSLRVKYTKQSTIINMLIHFLITYIHSHQSSFSKQNIEVSTEQHSNNNIKSRPTLLEIGYKNPKKLEQNKYSLLQPGTSNSVTYSLKLPENCAPEIKRSRINKSSKDINQILSVGDQVGLSSINRVNPQKSGITYSIKLPGQNNQLNQSDIQRSLLNILKENEELCKEENSDIITELDPEYDQLENEDLNFVDNIVEESATESSPNYTVSYPTENIEEEFPVAEPVYSPEAESLPIIESPPDVDINKEITFDNANTISKEVPIKIGSKLTNYKITHPILNNFEKSPIKNPTKVVDNVKIPNKRAALAKMKTSPKFIKIPVKNVKAASNFGLPKANKKTDVPFKKPSEAKSTSSTQSKNISNAEGTLLKLLKENEKIKNDKPIIKQESPNLDTLMNDVEMEKAFDFYSLGTDPDLSGSAAQTEDPLGGIQPQLDTPSSTVLNAPKDINLNYNILDNPKENLSTYVDNTQDEINMLQDILNDLTSKDLSDILSSETSPIPPINIDDLPVVDEEIVNECNPEPESTSSEYNFDSVDKYFKKHFLDF